MRAPKLGSRSRCPRMQTFLVASIPHSSCTLPLPGVAPVIGATQHVTTHTVHGRKKLCMCRKKLQGETAKRLTVTVYKMA